MKKEPREAVSGLKAAGVVALLASLLVLLPAASAGSWSMTLDVAAAPSVAEPGETVKFYYTLTNTGDYDLYNIEITGLGTVPDLSGVVLEAGVQQTFEGYYIMEEENAYNSACVTAENSKGRLVVRSYAGYAVMAA